MDTNSGKLGQENIVCLVNNYVIYYILFIFCLPLFLIYFLSCFIFPLIKFGKIKTGGGISIYIIKDSIHADYLIDSCLVREIFPTDKKFTKIGWGDRKIFLETKSWGQLKIKDFLYAFFGLNEAVVRVEFLEEKPKKFRKIIINECQLKIIKEHIIQSFKNEIIEKKPEYYQMGDFYKSNLNYNCITNCNNWVNLGLKKSKISNRLWCPISFWL